MKARTPPTFLSGDVVQLRSWMGSSELFEYVILHEEGIVTRRGNTTYIRCDAIEAGSNVPSLPKPRIEFGRNAAKKGGAIIPSTAKVVRHVRHEHLNIYLNIRATGGYGGPGYAIDWLSRCPPPIPNEWTKPSYRGGTPYTSHLWSDEEYRALVRERRILSPEEITRVRTRAGLDALGPTRLIAS